MLGKVIKNDFKSTARVVPVMFIATALVALGCFILLKLNLPVFTILGCIFLFLVMIATMIVTYILMFMRFYKSMYGREGYLSMSLPVSGGKLYAGKMITTLVWLALSGVILIGGIAVIFYIVSQMAGEQGVNLFKEAFSVMMPGASLWFYIGSLIIQFIYFTVVVFFCCTIANILPFQKLGVGMAFLSYIAIAIATSIINFLLMIFIPLGLRFTADGVELVTDNSLGYYLNNSFSVVEGPYGDAVVNGTSEMTIGIGSVLFQVVVIAVLIAVTIRLINKKVNVR